jgi:hypothetical protein
MKLPLSALVLATLLALPHAAHAQSEFVIDFVPRTGFTMPMNSLGMVTAPEGSSRALDVARMRTAPFLSVAAHLSREGSPWEFRATYLRTAETDVTATASCAPGTGVCLMILVHVPTRARMSAATLGVGYARPVEDIAIEPFAFLGAGARQYAFHWQGAGEWMPGGSHQAWAPAFHLGTGIRTRIADGFVGTIQIEDYASWFTPLGSGGDSAMRDRPGSEGSAVRAGTGRVLRHDFALSLGLEVRAK